MSGFIKNIILNKMKRLSPGEILEHGNEYGFSISNKQAKNIADYLRNNNVDPFDKKERKKMLQELAKITDVETAKKANKLFNELIKQYGLESLFK